MYPSYCTHTVLFEGVTNLSRHRLWKIRKKTGQEIHPLQQESTPRLNVISLFLVMYLLVLQIDSAQHSDVVEWACFVEFRVVFPNQFHT